MTFKTPLLNLVASSFLCFSSLSVAEEYVSPSYPIATPPASTYPVGSHTGSTTPREAYPENASTTISHTENTRSGNYYSETLYDEPRKASYGHKVANKAIRGVANFGASITEIPKNIIIVSNESNFLYGMTAGLGLGMMNTIFRSMVGVTDLVFCALPPQPVVYPVLPWDDYLTVDTNYQGMFVTDF